ncbi:MAG: PEP-CTERM sorting domain-containing protein [Planctomycetota bacterium]
MNFGKRKVLTGFTSACALACFAPIDSSAAVIVQYATAAGSPQSPVVVDSSVTADNLVAGSGLTALTFSTFNFSGWDTASTSFAAAVAANDFWTWGFDVTGLGAGETLDLTDFDIRLDRSGSGPDDVDIQVAVNGGTASTVFTHDYGDSSAGVNFLDIDLSAFTGLSNGDSVVFTLAAYNSESSGGTFDLETITFPGGNDAIVINGTVIPEPASLVLIGLGSLAMLSRRGKSA